MKKRLILVLKGLCMGTADVIPGVSGGTMALIMGIYERLVAAIRLIDIRTLRLALMPRSYARLFTLIRRPDEENDLDADDHRIGAIAFLLTLGTGILAAVLTGVRIIPVLLERYPAPTAGFFFGLILASLVVPYRLMKQRTVLHLLVFLAVATGTYVLVGLPTSETRFAHGEVVVVADAGLSTPSVLSASSTVFVASREGAMKDGKVSKGALTFRPTSDIPWPEGQRELTVPVIATRSGVDANVPGGTIQTTIAPIAGVSEIRQLAPMQGGADTPLWYIFVCGAIAICAMILPGISGSFLLLLLGEYGYVLHQVHELVYRQQSAAIVIVAVFVAGILVGILSFSRLLNWLLVHAHAITMAALIGLMLGSLRKIWPFQVTTLSGYENVLPTALDNTVLVTLGTFVLGMLIVIAMTIVGARKEMARAAT